MDAGLGHIWFVDYGEFEYFFGYQITCIGSNVNWLSSQKLMLGLVASHI
jgi:hypothetical protein